MTDKETDKKKNEDAQAKSPEDATALDKLIQEFDDEAVDPQDLGDLDEFLSDDALDDEDEFAFLDEDDLETEALLTEGSSKKGIAVGTIASLLLFTALAGGAVWLGWNNRGILSDKVSEVAAHVESGSAMMGDVLQDNFSPVFDEIAAPHESENIPANDGAVSFEFPEIVETPMTLTAVDATDTNDSDLDMAEEAQPEIATADDLFFDFEAMSREEEKRQMDGVPAISIEPMVTIPATDYPSDPLIEQDDIEKAAQIMREAEPTLVKPAPKTQSIKTDASKAPSHAPHVPSVPRVSAMPSSAQAIKKAAAPVTVDAKKAEAAATARLNATAALLGQAKMAERAGNGPEALRLYEQILKVAPQHPVAKPAWQSLAAVIQLPAGHSDTTRPAAAQPVATEQLVAPPMVEPKPVSRPAAMPTRPSSITQMPSSQPSSSPVSGGAALALYKQALDADKAGEFSRALSLYREALQVDAVQYNGQSLNRGQVYDRISVMRDRLGQ